jgi:hypothetical protein
VLPDLHLMCILVPRRLPQNRYVYRNRATLVPQCRAAANWLREVSSDFTQIHVIEPVKNIYTELVYREHFVLGKAETIKNELAYSRVQFTKVLTLWENAARSSMGGERQSDTLTCSSHRLRRRAICIGSPCRTATY